MPEASQNCINFKILVDFNVNLNGSSELLRLSLVAL